MHTFALYRSEHTEGILKWRNADNCFSSPFCTPKHVLSGSLTNLLPIMQYSSVIFDLCPLQPLLTGLGVGFFFFIFILCLYGERVNFISLYNFISAFSLCTMKFFRGSIAMVWVWVFICKDSHPLKIRKEKKNQIKKGTYLYKLFFCLDM